MSVTYMSGCAMPGAVVGIGWRAASHDELISELSVIPREMISPLPNAAVTLYNTHTHTPAGHGIVCLLPIIYVFAATAEVFSFIISVYFTEEFLCSPRVCQYAI